MAKPNVLIDNKKIKVTEWFFEVGDSTGMHVHEYDYIVVPMLDGELKILDKKNNERISKLINIINNHLVSYKIIDPEEPLSDKLLDKNIHVSIDNIDIGYVKKYYNFPIMQKDGEIEGQNVLKALVHAK